MRMKQTEKALKYIQDFGSINPLQALNDLGIMRLASRICDLKNEGYPIHKEMKTAKNRYGEPVHYAEYSLKEK